MNFSNCFVSSDHPLLQSVLVLHVSASFPEYSGLSSSRMLSGTKEPRKSALKKSSSYAVEEEQKTSLAVKGLGKRQKSFVQFDENAVVIDDGAHEPPDNNIAGGTQGIDAKICHLVLNIS